MSEAVIFNIERGSLHDGPGIRTVVFIKGCSLNCCWCHNPEGISPKPQLFLYDSRCIGCGRCAGVCPGGAIIKGAAFDPGLCRECGRCAGVCPSEARLMCGEKMSDKIVFERVMRDKRYFGTGGGVTLSGGECLTAVRFCADLLRLCREAGIHTAIESALFVPWESVKTVLPYCDLFIADMKMENSGRHRLATGKSNETIKSNLKRLFGYKAENKAPEIWIRTPLIPGFTDDGENLRAIEAFLDPWKELINKREFLEYNKFGEAKKAALIHPEKV